MIKDKLNIILLMVYFIGIYVWITSDFDWGKYVWFDLLWFVAFAAVFFAWQFIDESEGK